MPILKHIKIVFLKALFSSHNLSCFYERISFEERKINLPKNIKTMGNKFVCVIRDIPGYLTLKEQKSDPKLKFHRVKTLKGYLIELTNYRTIDAYLNANFGTKSRSNLRRYTNRLEKCFDISYVCYWGDISKEEYLNMFTVLRDLLQRRFVEKREVNYELQHLEEFQLEVYDLILKKEASLYVIYEQQKPISIRINLFKDKLSFYMLSCYDIDYAKFHLGSIDMLKNIEWCIANHMLAYDLLKGYEYYKKNWMTKTFNYYNHIIYGTGKTITLYAYYQKIKTQFRYAIYHRLKAYQIDKAFRKIKQVGYSFLHKNHIEPELKIIATSYFNASDAVEIAIEEEKYHFLKKNVFDFLFISQEQLKDIKVFKAFDAVNHFQIVGKKNSYSFLLVR